MIQLIIYLSAGGAFLLGMLFLLLRRRSAAEGGAEAVVEARNALNMLQFSLLPPELIARIFAREDQEYIEQTTTREIQKFFVQERRQIALLWIQQVRSQLVGLRRFYVGRSRFYARMSGWTELSLAMNFLLLVTACRILQLALYVRGPLAAPRMMGATIAKVGRVCEVSAKTFAYLKPMNPRGIGSDEAENGAAL